MGAHRFPLKLLRQSKRTDLTSGCWRTHPSEEGNRVFIVYTMREERQLRAYMLENS
jgi:hypothetical protein